MDGRARAGGRRRFGFRRLGPDRRRKKEHTGESARTARKILFVVMYKNTVEIGPN